MEIKLHSRYSDVETYLNTDTSIITTNSNYTRIIGDTNAPIAIDFEGGPYIEIGQTLRERKVKRIEIINSYKFKIIF